MARCPKCKGNVEIKPEQEEVKCSEYGTVLKRPPKKEEPLPVPGPDSKEPPTSQSVGGTDRGQRKKVRLMWGGVAALFIILGAMLLALARPWLAESLRGAKERHVRERAVKERTATYPQYLEKARPFYDSLLRTNSDLEVGINYADYGERLREMNFQYNTWKQVIGIRERLYPSARAMQLALQYYIAAQRPWKLSIDWSDHPSLSERKELKDTERQRNWEVAGRCLDMARLCMDAQDLAVGLACNVCDGTGGLLSVEGDPKVECPLCAGTGVYPPKGAVGEN